MGDSTKVCQRHFNKPTLLPTWSHMVAIEYDEKTLISNLRNVAQLIRRPDRDN
jgi:hypothetical protein